jgi:hypothetical protein
MNCKTIFHLSTILLLGFVATLFSACTALESTIYDKPQKKQLAKGIPYLLPKGHVELSLQIKKTAEGRFEDIHLESVTKLVPDPKELYVLNPNYGLFTKKDQKITLKDGMLASIHTEDDGQLDEAIKAIAGTWVNFMKIGVLKGTLKDIKSPQINTTPFSLVQNRDKVKIVKKWYPELIPLKQVYNVLQNINFDQATEKIGSRVFSTNTEQKDLLSDNTVDNKSLVYQDFKESTDEQYGLYFTLKITPDTRIEDAVYAKGKHPEELIKPKLSPGFEEVPGVMVPGIMVKVPEPKVFNLKLNIIPKQLYLYRLENYNDQLASLGKVIDKFNAKESDYEKSKREASNKIEAAKIQIESIDNCKSSTSTCDRKPEELKEDRANQDKIIAEYTVKKSEIQAALDKAKKNKDMKLSIEDEVKANLALLYLLTRSEQKDIWKIPDNVFERAMVALVPSKYAVNVPLKNSWIGKTTYDLTLDRGVLTSYNMEKPAELVEVVRLPLDVTSEFISLLTNFVQFKINMVGKTDEYTDAKIKLAETEFKLQQLTKKQEKENLKLEKELAEAKFDFSQVSIDQERKVISEELEFQKKILTLQTENIQKSSEIQTALINQINFARTASLENDKKVAELKAVISNNVLIIKGNQKKIAELQEEMKNIAPNQ